MCRSIDGDIVARHIGSFQKLTPTVLTAQVTNGVEGVQMINPYENHLKNKNGTVCWVASSLSVSLAVFKLLILTSNVVDTVTTCETYLGVIVG